MTDDYDDVEKFIKNIIEHAEKAMEDKYEFSGELKFEISIVKTKGAKGEGKFVVVEAGGKYEKEKISKVTILIKPKEKKKKIPASAYHIGISNK